MLNHIVLMGRLTRDPEMRRTNSGIAVTSFSLAVDRDFGKNEAGEKETDFIDCVAWRQTGEFVSKYFAKGRMAVVSGRLQIRPWTDKDGNKRRTAEVVCDNVYFGDSKRDGESNGSSYGGGYSGGSYGGNGGYNPGNNGGFGGNGGYNSGNNAGYNAGNGGFGHNSGYAAPAAPSYAAPAAPASDFAMLEDDDSQLPF